jgi:hypothetical protein
MFTFVPMNYRRVFKAAYLVAASLSMAACQRYVARNEIVNDRNTYFSIKQFAADQIHTYGQQPFSMFRINKLNGTTDTTLSNFINMDWAPIFRSFGETDISDKKFLGQYDFSVYDESITGRRILSYTAKNNKLLTRLLQIAADPTNNKITSIYIETAQNDFWGSQSQKLLYVPLRVIQIQKSRHGLLGKAWDLNTEYRFGAPGQDSEEF